MIEVVSELDRSMCFFYAGVLRGLAERLAINPALTEDDVDMIANASEQLRLLSFAHYERKSNE